MDVDFGRGHRRFLHCSGDCLQRLRRTPPWQPPHPPTGRDTVKARRQAETARAHWVGAPGFHTDPTPRRVLISQCATTHNTTQHNTTCQHTASHYVTAYQPAQQHATLHLTIHNITRVALAFTCPCTLNRITCHYFTIVPNRITPESDTSIANCLFEFLCGR